MNELVNPTSIAPPAARYSHGVVSAAGSRLLHTAGTVGTRPDGTMPETVGEEAAQVWANLAAICEAAGFTLADTVSYTTYMVVGVERADVMAARDAALGDHRPASTLIPVPALAQPQWRVEVALVAAR